MIMHFIRWLRNTLQRRRVEREAAEEMRQHIDLEIEERVRYGADPAEARRTALRDFGGVDRWQEEARAARGWRWLDELSQDMRYGVRGLLHAPGFTTAAVLTLGLAIGANTAVFSVLNGVLLRPLGYPDADRLVRMFDYRDDEVGTGRGTISYANFADMAAAARLWERAAAYDEWRVSITIGGVAERFDAAIVDAAWFDVLGVKPALGRFFGPDEATPGATSRVVLSWAFWQQQFGSDPGVIGRAIETNGVSSEIIGVAPADMEDPAFSGASFAAPVLWRSPAGYFTTNSRGSRSFAGLVRLVPGVTLEQAQQEADALQAQLVAAYPDNNAGRVVRLVPLAETIVGDIRAELLILFAAVGLVLLVACANVGGLLLVRGSAREREITVRQALGASRARVVRQLLLENVLLGAAGALVGCVIAWLGTGLFSDYVTQHLPRGAQITIDGRLLAFTVLLTIAATLLFGTVPALFGSRAEMSASLRSADRNAAGARAGTRLRALIVATEVALAVVVLISAGLLTRSLLRLQAVDTGMLGTDQVVSMTLQTSVYEIDALPGYYGSLLARVRALPGVQSAGMIDILPMSGSFNSGPFTIQGQPTPAMQDRPDAELRAVSAGYFETLGVPLLRGRLPSASDDGSAPRVVVISESLARRYFPDADPLGQRVETYDDARTIVGVVGDVAQFTLDQPAAPTMYFPQAQAPEWMRAHPVLVVRGDRDARALMTDVRAAVRAQDPRVPVAQVRTLENVVDDTLVLPRFRTALLALFAGISFALAVVGIYGTVSYAAERRRRELGVRMALGARRADVVMLVLARGMLPVLVGAVAGILLSLAATRVLQSMLFSVSAADPGTFALVPMLLVATAAFAAAIPAARVTRAAALQALREE